MRGRFAPSPTGELHLGNARTALLAWLQARSAGGRFVMRVEDLDRGRVRPGAMQQQLAELRWLGLDWDEGPDVDGDRGPYLQSRRTDRYLEALRRLAAQDLLFACSCSRRDIAAAASAPHGPDDEGPRYPGRCAARSVAPHEIGPVGFSREGAIHALRFRVPERTVEFLDELHGRCAYRPFEEVGDFVVRRKDGAVAYQLAVAIDDAAMGITHVLRGADLLGSTARQILLYEALGLAAPQSWTHVPLLLGPDGERLSKRHGAVSLREYRDGGVEPDALVGCLAATCGLAEPGERVRAADLVSRFSIARLPREPSVVDPAHLDALLGAPPADPAALRR